jgi:hypothetical protein
MAVGNGHHATVTKSTEANLLPITARGFKVDAGSRSHGTGPKGDFKAGRAKRDLLKKAAPTLAKKEAILDEDAITLEGMALGPYCHGFRVRQDLRRFGSVNITAGNDIWCLLLHRSYAQKAFSRAELAQLSRLSRPLSSTATLARLINFVRAEGALAALEFNGHAAALVDRNAEILRMNDACKRLFGRNFVIRKGRIFARDQGSRLHQGRSGATINNAATDAREQAPARGCDLSAKVLARCAGEQLRRPNWVHCNPRVGFFGSGRFSLRECEARF